jgi:thiamine pyrophosphokinase
MPEIRLSDTDRGAWTVFSDESQPSNQGGPRVALLAGGQAPPEERLRSEVAGAEALVCTGGGLRAAWASGLVPELVAGNLSDLPDWVTEQLSGDALVDDRSEEGNDLEKALREVFHRWGAAAEVTLLGAGTGGQRSDQSLANLGVILAEPHRRIQWVDRTGRMVALRRGKLEIEDAVGSKLSILPWSLHGAIVSVVGSHYPLDEERLYLGGRGISNEIGDEIATVDIEEGVALIWVDI